MVTLHSSKETEKKAKYRGISGSDILTTSINRGPLDSAETSLEKLLEKFFRKEDSLSALY